MKTTTIKKPESKAKEAAKQMEESREYLRKIFEVDQRVYTRLISVSASGMSRVIALYVARNNEIEDITWDAAKATGRSLTEKGIGRGIVIKGCGMDMGFSLVHGLSYALYGYEGEGGYRLKQKWL